MRRRPAVGVVLCNRTLSLFRIGLPSSCPVTPVTGPRRTRPYTHTLTFPVTTAYITLTCSTVQPLHTHVTPTWPFSLPFNVCALYPLIYLSPRSRFFHYIIASHSPAFLALTLATFLNVLFWFVDSYPGLILLLLLFLFSVYNGRASFFSYLVVIGLDCHRSN